LDKCEDRAKKKETIENYIKARDELFGSFRKLEELVGSFNENSPLWKSLCLADDTMQEMASNIIDDDCGTYGVSWLNWFVYDNDSGKNGYTAEIDGVSYVIKTVDDLLDLIDKYNEGEKK